MKSALEVDPTDEIDRSQQYHDYHDHERL